jgi:hypothetical protein
MYPWSAFSLGVGALHPSHVSPRIEKLREYRSRSATSRNVLAVVATAVAALLSVLLPFRASAQVLSPKQMARVMTPATAQEIASARSVELGAFTCSDGLTVTLLDLPSAPGKFLMTVNSANLLFESVPTQTGAVRLEERSFGLAWIQLPNKSMLLDQRAGKRIADECTNHSQQRFAASNRLPTLLD